LRSLVIATACLGLGACATIKAPPYQSSIENVQALQGSSGKASVGAVKVDEAKATELNSISLRTNTMQSPYGDYAGYLKEALRADLVAAGKYDQNSPRAINAVLTRNSLEAGADKGLAEVAARFTVTEGGKVLYDKEQVGKRDWESSFIGAVAIPRAVQNYGAAVQNLLARLFADPDFKKALGD
jgi:hypothetical protein